MRAFAVLMVLGLAVAGWFVYDGWRFLNSPLTSEPVRDFEIFVERGDSIGGIANRMATEGLLAKPHWLKWYARYTGASRKIRSGEFLLTTSITPIELLGELQSGRERQHSFTIVEGWTIWQLREQLAKDSVLVHKLVGVSDAQLMELIGAPGLHPEGQFLPDTYLFPRGTSDIEFLRRAHQALQKTLAQLWLERQENLPMSDSYEALVLASIVERETGVAGERGLIAGVMVSRLRKKMRLQTDPTVIYGIGPAFNGNITRKDLKTPTPYNTYVIKGLPPTPIAMVGVEALQAAMQPASTTALFFVADGTGGHVFSDTVEQHNAAVRKYILKKK